MFFPFPMYTYALTHFLINKIKKLKKQNKNPCIKNI